MRAAAVVAAGTALVLGVAAVVFAQQPPPTIPITASETSLAVGTSGPVAAGPTRFELIKSGGGDVGVAIAALRPGVTVDQAIAATRSADENAILELVHLDSVVTLPASQERRGVTVRLRPNSTYLVVNITGDRPADFETATFTVGAPGTAAAPKADARVRMVDLRFRGDSTLPLRGIVRVENAGWAPHFAVAIPLRRRASTDAVGRALRGNNERQLNRLLDFRSAADVQGLVSRGAVNYSEVRFPRRGRYAMVCFFQNHNRQGMYRFVRVR
jgi:hypothetical protein